MTKQNEHKNIPELRFPEFKDDGEWRERKLGEITEINPSSSKLPNEFAYVDLESVENGVLLQKKVISKDEAPSRAQRLLRNEDVIFQMVRPYQKNNYYFKKNDNLDYVASTGYAQLRVFESSMYLYQFLHTDNFVSRVLSKCTGSNYPAINSSDLSNILIQIPKPKEQQKIADCLSSLDEIITAHSDKLKVLKDYKKGLMQVLFPQQGEKIPKCRFKEFKDDGEWEEERLLDIVDKKIKWSFTGGPFGSNLKASDYTSTGIRIIQLQNIGDGRFIDDYKIYTSEEKADELLSCNIYSGDIILSKMGDPVGRACFIPSKLDRCVMASDGIRLVVDERRYSKYFVFSLINSPKIRASIEKKSTGSTRRRIGLDELKTIPLLIPREQKEQQKIADTLSSLDNLIAVQSEKIEQLKAHKKGLMQKLFPAINE